MTTIFATRELPVAFWVAVKVMVELFEPESVFTVNHVWSLFMIQLVFDVIVKMPVLFAEVNKLKLLVDSERVGDIPACVTVMV